MVGMASSMGKISVTSFWSAIRTFTKAALPVALGGPLDRVAVELHAEPRPADDPDLAFLRGQIGRRHQVLDQQLVHDLVAVREVGRAEAEVMLGGVGDATDALAVQADGDAGDRSDGGGPAEGEQATGLVCGQADGVAGPLPDEVVHVVRREHRLVGGDGHVDGLAHLAHGRHAEQRRRLLHPVEAVGLERVDHADGVGHAPGAVGVHAQTAAADGFAHGRRVPDVRLVAAADLQVDDAVPGLGEVAGVLHQLLGRVALDEPEVVDFVADGAAEEPVHRLAGGLADRVPQRHLEPGQHEVREPRHVVEAPEVARFMHQPPHVVDGLAEEQGLDGSAAPPWSSPRRATRPTRRHR